MNGAAVPSLAIMPPSSILPLKPDLVTVIGEPFTEEQYGIAIRKGNKELLAKVNAALARLG